MPPVSRQQAKAMYAAAEGRSTLGIPKAVGQEFTAPLKGQTGSVDALPKRAPKQKSTTMHIHIHLPGAK